MPLCSSENLQAGLAAIILLSLSSSTISQLFIECGARKIKPYVSAIVIFGVYAFICIGIIQYIGRCESPSAANIGAEPKPLNRKVIFIEEIIIIL